MNNTSLPLPVSGRLRSLLLCLGLALALASCAGSEHPSAAAPANATPAQAGQADKPTTPSQGAGGNQSQPRDLFSAFSEGPAEFNALFANPARPTLPDLSKAVKLGQQPAQDFLPTVPGAETTVTGYQLDKVGILVFSLPNGKIYAFTLRKIDSGEERSYFDKEGDGIFEQQGESGDVNEKAYGY